MKQSKLKGLFTLLILCVGFAVFAQTNAISRYYDEYRADERFTKISISGKMFSLFTNVEVEQDKDQGMAKMLSKLKGLKMLVGDSIPDAKALYMKASLMPEKDMEELMSVEKGTGEMKFFITEANGLISELVMLAYNEQHLVLMSLVGDIDLEALSKLSKNIDIDGFENLQNLDKEKK